MELKNKISDAKILFLSYTATISGAPLILLNFASWIRVNYPNIQMDIILLQSGSYLEKFKQTFDNIYVLDDERKKTLTRKGIEFAMSQLGFSNEKKILKKIRRKNYCVIFCNTIPTLSLGLKIKSFFTNTKLILHIHELAVLTKFFSPNFKIDSQQVDEFIVVCEASRQLLLNEYFVNENKIALINEFIDDHPAYYEQPIKKLSRFKVGGSGSLSWRKGYDLFLLVAFQFKKRFPQTNINFEWVGGGDNYTFDIIHEDIKKLNLQDTVTFSGETTMPREKFKTFDIFLLTSREDPFPLVCIEAGALSIPVIAFKKSGGMEQLLSNGGGVLANYLDIEAVVDAIYQYFLDTDKLSNDGKIIRERTRHLRTNIKAPAIFKILFPED